MTLTRRYAILAPLVCLALFVGACVPGAANESVIATSVAQTVEAQGTETAAAVTPTSLPTRTRTPLASATGLTTKAPPTAPTGGPALCTADATFVSETIPDGTILSPGAAFTKLWRIQNTGTCPWNKTWKLVFFSGELMGGAAVYDFPAIALPGNTVDVPIVLTAPLSAGAYRGNWKIQSPWGQVFGDSGSRNPFWVDIIVGSGTPENAQTLSVYGITNVTYTIERRCTTANTFWHIYVNLTSNGPVDVVFNVEQSDGNGQRKIPMSFTSATTQTYDYGEWGQRFTSSTQPRWVQAIVTSPAYFVWPASAPFYLCGY